MRKQFIRQKHAVIPRASTYLATITGIQRYFLHDTQPMLFTPNAHLSSIEEIERDSLAPESPGPPDAVKVSLEVRCPLVALQGEVEVHHEGHLCVCRPSSSVSHMIHFTYVA